MNKKRNQSAERPTREESKEPRAPPKMEKASKKIHKEKGNGQKLNPKAAEKARIESRIVKAKEEIPKEFATLDNYSDFVKEETSKYLKIRKQTIKQLPIDPQQVKQAVKALVKYFNKTKSSSNLLDTNDDFIYLEVVMSKVPTKYSIRPIQM